MKRRSSQRLSKSYISNSNDGEKRIRGEKKLSGEVSQDKPKGEKPCFALTGLGSHIRICCSGYVYEDWHSPGSYYEGLPKRSDVEFSRYAEDFDTVELNGTFYSWNPPSTFETWKKRADSVRPSFEYALKASQFYTHKKRLNIDEYFKESWKRFYNDRVLRLQSHLGPVLFQFPSSFRRFSYQGQLDNIERLKRLGEEVLPKSGRFVFEFRDISWYCEEVYDVMRQFDWCLALVDVTGAKNSYESDSWAGTLAHGPNPKPDKYPSSICSWGCYIRFHGATGKYEGSYGPKKMKEWARYVHKWASKGKTVYVAFNNDTLDESSGMPAAILDARHLSNALREIGSM